MAFRSLHFVTFSQLLILSASQVSMPAQDCAIDVILKRNSKAEALSGDSLKINCTVKYCDQKPAVEWCKVGEQDNECSPFNQTDVLAILWKDTEEKTGILSLHFKHIAMNDSGLYRCESKCDTGVCTSHAINVTVEDAPEHKTQTDRSEWFWPAIYISSGVASLIIITALICVGIRFCRGSPQTRAKKAEENQYAAVQMSDIGPSLHDSHHQSRPNSQPTPVTAQSQVECVYENGSGLRSRPISNVSSGDAVVPPQRHSANHAVTQHREAEDEVSPLVYASLNHQVTTRPHTRPVKVKEESTEYAAICLS